VERARAGHALKRTPATKSPGVPRGAAEGVTVACDDVALLEPTAHLHLDALHRGVDEAHRPPAPASSPSTCQALERLSELHLDAAHGDPAEPRKPELEVRREVLGREVEACSPQIVEDVHEVLPHEGRQHEVVVEARPQRTGRLA